MTWRRPDRPPWPPEAFSKGTPPHLKRYGWLRLYNDFISHPKWRAIATMTALPLHEVTSVALACLLKANVGRPRGSLAEFSISETAAALDLPGDHVRRMWAALNDHGWIDGDYLVTWDERQPDREDPTNKARQQRFRDKRKEERKAMRNGVTPDRDASRCNENTVTRHGSITENVTHRDAERDASRLFDEKTVMPVTENTVTRHGASRPKDPTAAKRAREYRARKRATVASVTRNAVTSVTSRPDQTRSDQQEGAPLVDYVEWSVSAAEWLTGQGLAILVERGKLRELPARVRLKRWRDDMQDDDALRDIIHHAATVAAEGRLVHMIGEAVARHVTQPLPLGPVTVRRNA